MGGPVRIAMVGRYYNRQGGISRCLAELSDRGAREDDVTVLAHEILDRRESSATFEQVGMLRRPAWVQAPSFSLAVDRRLRGGRFELVHAHGPQALTADLYTAHSCHAAYIGMRRAEGGIGALLSRVYPPHVTSLAWERRCLGSGSTPIIALTPRVKAELESHLGVDSERIHVIPNGVDTRHFQPPASRAQALHAVRELTGPVPEEAVVLLFAGYEFARKGLARVVEGIAHAGDERIRLWVAGGDDPAPYRRLAERLGIAERVLFLGHQREVRPLFQAADAFVLPSSYEALALVLLESLACGTPLITSRVAGVADFLAEGQEGFLLSRPEDPAELGAVLRRFASATDRWPAMGAAARSLAERLDWDLIWHRTRELYEEVLVAKSAAAAR